jgi:hypothetical protein
MSTTSEASPHAAVLQRPGHGARAHRRPEAHCTRRRVQYTVLTTALLQSASPRLRARGPAPWAYR